jgi:hypothetical protein
VYETPDELMRKGNELLSRARGHAVTWAEEAVHRMSPEGRKMAKRRKQRRQAAIVRTVKRIVVALAAVFAATLVAGLVLGPIGIGGVALMILAMVLVAVSVAVWSSSRKEEEPERFVAQSDLAQLPSRTDAWLERQRPALPAPAQRQLDQISLGLEQLGPQLAGLDTREPAAIEVRRLIGEELPELVRGYGRVPEHLRRQPLNGGMTPDRQLAEGLATIGEELGRMNAQLATGDLHALATQQRYLELKYKGEGADDSAAPALSPPVPSPPGKAS